ncbi:MAG: hypothetical protein OXK80_01000 [Bdellovibrionales bacterium]|nr:hypothetical protein [Bdellovibrionales bacterium]
MRAYLRSTFFKKLTQEEVENLTFGQVISILRAGRYNPSLFQIVGWIPAGRLPSVFNLIPDRYLEYLTQEQVELLSNSQLSRLLKAIKNNEELFSEMIRWVLSEQIPFILSSIPSQYLIYLTQEQIEQIPLIQRQEVESERDKTQIRSFKEEDSQKKDDSMLKYKPEMRLVQ